MPEDTIDFVLKRVKALRLKHGLTQEQFSELSGIAYKYYQHLEAGRRRDLRLSTLERIASAYGIAVHQLLAPKEPRSETPTVTNSKVQAHRLQPKKRRSGEK